THSVQQPSHLHTKRLRQFLERGQRRVLPCCFETREVAAADARALSQFFLTECSRLSECLNPHRGSLDRSHRYLSVTSCQGSSPSRRSSAAMACRAATTHYSISLSAR